MNVAGLEGIEPPIEVLETSVMPFNYSPISFIIDYFGFLDNKPGSPGIDF